MYVYEIKTDWSRYTVTAKDFDDAVRKSKKILTKEKGLYGEDESPAVTSIVEGDEVNRV